MGFMYEFPHSRMFDSDLREILEIFNAVKEIPTSMEQYKENIDETLKEFIERTDDTIVKTTKEWLEENSPNNIVHPYVLVDDFGAVGNGIADDTNSIQEAINFAALNNKVVVFTPKRTYFINTVHNGAALRLPNNTILVGNGATLKVGQNLMENMLIVNDSDEITGEYGANNNITINSLKFDGSHGITTLIGFHHCTNVRITSCDFTDLIGWHMVELNAVNRGVVDNCTFTKYYGSVEDVTEMLQLDCSNERGTFPPFGPYDKTHCKNIIIVNNTFSNDFDEIDVNAWPTSAIGNHTNVYEHEPHEIIIANNTFRNLFRAIKFVSICGFTIANNMIVDCLTGIYLNGQGRFVNGNISNNYLYGKEYTEILPGYQGRGISVGNNTDNVGANNFSELVNITNNQVTNFYNYGISLNGHECQITNNTVTNTNGPEGRGISIAYAQNNVVIKGNCVRGSGEGDLYIFNVQSSNVYITDNLAEFVIVALQGDSTYLIGNIIEKDYNNVNWCKHMNNIVNGVLQASNL